MSRFDIDEFEIELWRRAANECTEESQRLRKEMNDDPTSVLLEVHLKFAKLLEENTGDSRLTPQFKVELDKLSRKEKRAKLRAKTYSLTEASDNYHNAMLKQSQIIGRLNNLEFRFRLRREKCEEARDKSIVEKILDDVVEDN